MIRLTDPDTDPKKRNIKHTALMVDLIYSSEKKKVYTLDHLINVGFLLMVCSSDMCVCYYLQHICI